MYLNLKRCQHLLCVIVIDKGPLLMSKFRYYPKHNTWEVELLVENLKDKRNSKKTKILAATQTTSQ